jgi:hypothetical protein
MAVHIKKGYGVGGGLWCAPWKRRHSEAGGVDLLAPATTSRGEDQWSITRLAVSEEASADLTHRRHHSWWVVGTAGWRLVVGPGGITT